MGAMCSTTSDIDDVIGIGSPTRIYKPSMTKKHFADPKNHTNSERTGKDSSSTIYSTSSDDSATHNSPSRKKLNSKISLNNNNNNNARQISTNSDHSIDLISPLHVMYGAPTMRTHVRQYGISMSADDETEDQTNKTLTTIRVENENENEQEDEQSENENENEMEDELNTSRNDAWENMMPRSSTTTPVHDSSDQILHRQRPTPSPSNKNKFNKSKNTSVPSSPSTTTSTSTHTTTNATISPPRIPPLPRSHLTFDRKHAFRATQRHPRGSIREYIHRKYLSQVTLGRRHPTGLSLHQIVLIPKHRSSKTISTTNFNNESYTITKNKWVATHVLDFFNEISVIYGTISNKCNETDCSCMSAGPKYTYKWADGNVVTTPIRLPAKEYVRLLLEWVDEQISNTDVFTSTLKTSVNNGNGNGNSDYENEEVHPMFEDVVGHIFKRLFRVYAHIYHSHYPYICSLQLDRALNACFGRFVWFIHEYDLVEDRHLKPMKEVMDEIMEKSGGLKNPSPARP